MEVAEKKEVMEKDLRAKAERMTDQACQTGGERHGVKVRALEIELKALHVNLKYGTLLVLQHKHRAEMVALRKENQDFKLQKERCEEEKDLQIAAVMRENQELQLQKERCEEEKDLQIAAVMRENQELQLQKERCEEEKDLQIAAVMRENQELQLQKERCEEEKDLQIAAVMRENQEL
ncbi:hypothetical protein PBY51_017027 [Eleginops maclovinus]|uniref:Uncharacterized protein n=1 Tax=Eleginops maclovinus TaxID=56733 RepID=A0AAN7WB21_ELEMC|nr:hypothetical protein PBY51_017027 [Eleginops maclovinus]